MGELFTLGTVPLTLLSQRLTNTQKVENQHCEISVNINISDITRKG